MSDVFVSYASTDREAAQALAGELQRHGLSVWWDRAIPPGRQFDEVIEEALDGARCVLLLWSPAAAASHWVKTEGAEALRRGVLVPALLTADVRIPLEFRRVQAADLSAWQAGQPSPAFDQLLAAIRETVQRGPGPQVPRTRPRRPAPPVPAPAPAPAPAPTATPSPPAAPGARKTWVWVAAGVVGIGVLYNLVNGNVGGSVTPVSPGPGPSSTQPLAPVAAPAAQPTSPPAPAAAAQSDTGNAARLTGLGVQAANGFDLPLRWRDYVLAYEGRLRWDGRSTLGNLALRATDSGTGLVVAEGSFTALLLADTPTRMVFVVQVPVPMGDSRTVGPHTHPVNLVFEQQPGGGWLFRRNCMAPGRPDLCYE
jgi:hypothetical protein